MKNLFANWSWERTWATVFLTAVITISIIGVIALCADHRILYYEVFQPDDARVPTYCVAADRNWEQSERVACFTDSDQALRVLVMLNGELRKR